MPENVYRSPHPILWLFPLSPCHSLLTRAITLQSENDTEHPLILPLYFIYPSFSSLRPQPLLFLHDGRLGVLRPLLPPQGPSFVSADRSHSFRILGCHFRQFYFGESISPFSGVVLMILCVFSAASETLK